MKSKKAQGLSLNTIIIAAIALIVLVVLVMVFTGRMGGFTRGLGKATTCDQACKAGGYTGTAAKGDNATTCTAAQGERLVGYKWGEGTAAEQGYACCCKNTP